MEILFTTNYHTQWGEELCASIDIHQNSKCIAHQTLQLETNDGHTWKGTTQINDLDFSHLFYTFYIRKNGIIQRTEAEDTKHCWRNQNKPFCSIEAGWHDEKARSYLESAVFTQCIYPIHSITHESPDPEKVIQLKVEALLPPNMVLGILGSSPILGEWNPAKTLKMQQVQVNGWEITLNADRLNGSFEYKYVTIDRNSNQLVQWENGPNRTFNNITPHVDAYFKEDTTARLQTIPWRGAGVVIPLFSLRSKSSYGVGDFGDLKKMIDWCAMVRMSVVQLLPINDTTQTRTWRDSYPYNSISVFALHPMYLNLNRLGTLPNKEEQKHFEQLRHQLNALPEVDYERVNTTKRTYIESYFRQQGHKELNTKQYAHFFANNKEWLLPYAAFCYFRDLYGTANFRDWPRLNVYDAEQIEALWLNDGHIAKKMSFYFYVQYKLHEQLTEVHAHARKKGVIIKGDIPIGISRNSVPAWVEPHYFNFNGQAGAPPDDFAADGQNWGFPTYNWQTMLADNCDWWKRRLKKMAEYFDAYRIDHVLGFFRIWEIPYESISGLSGHFVPSLPFSVEEIQQYNFPFDKQNHTIPHTPPALLYGIFQTQALDVATTFMDEDETGSWTFKPSYNSQRKLREYTSLPDNNIGQNTQEKLEALLNNVLFIEDSIQPGKFHPRILAQKTPLFQTLSAEEKEAFNRLYNDYYYHRHNQFWYDEAMKKLPILTKATDMLACAEDLGMVPECVKWVLEKEQILSLEIQRMPKSQGTHFGKTETYPYLSVATIATHDMPPLRLWWQQQTETVRQCFFQDVLHQNGPVPQELSPALCSLTVQKHLESPSMFCLLALQDWFSIQKDLCTSNMQQEQINDPSNPDQYWNYRMHVTIEELIYHTAFNNTISDLISRSGR